MKQATKYVYVIFIFVAMLLSGCTMQRVTSSVLGEIESPIERFAIVVKDGKFTSGNRASRMGNKNYQSIRPHMQVQLPLVFEQYGVEARTMQAKRKADKKVLKVKDGEAMLFIHPVSASYSSRSGQHLKLQGILLAPGTVKPVWKATINLSTPGFGNFGEDLAKNVAIGLLNDLHDDEVIVLAGGRIEAVYGAGELIEGGEDNSD